LRKVQNGADWGQVAAKAILENLLAQTQQLILYD
jgi:hypothetical protein